MKKPLLINGLSKTVLALLAASVTYCTDAFADAKIYVGSLAINAGETTEAELIIENDENIVDVQYMVKLPAGLSIVDGSVNENRIKKDSHELDYNLVDAANNIWTILLSSSSGKTIKGNSGAVATLSFEADATFAGGDITPVAGEVGITSDQIDENGNNAAVKTEAPVTSINQLNVALNITPNAITVSADENMATISVGMNNSKPVNSFSCKVVLPDGVKPKLDEDDDVDCTKAARVKAFALGINYKEAENVIIFTLSNNKGALIGAGEGELFSFGVEADVKTLAETSTIAFIEGKAADANAVTVDIDLANVNIENTWPAYDKVRQEANTAAAQADMERLEAMQADLTAAIAGNEAFITPDDKDIIEDILGDTWPMTIQGTLEGVETEGTYESLIDWEKLAANIAEVKANIAAAQQAEADRVAANTAAAQADMERLEAMQADLTAAIAGNEAFITPDDKDIIEDILGDTWPMTIQGTLEGVETEGTYESLIDWEKLAANIAEVKANIAAAQQAEADRVAANTAAAQADMERLEAMQADLTAAIAGNEAFITPDDKDIIEDILGDTWPMTIQGTLEGVETEGTYESLIDWEKLAANIAEVKANIAAAQQAEADRVAANTAAAQADMERLEAMRADLTAAIAGNEAFITPDDKDIIEDILGDTWPMTIQGTLEGVETEGTYESLIDWEKLAANIAEVKANIEAAKVNSDVWEAIQQQIAQVEAAIADFETIVATLPYASHFEGEEITGPVDAAREWVATKTDACTAKHEAGELTAEDSMLGEMKEQIAAVHEAINNAAHYDAQRHVQAAVYAWAGDEDEIVGVKDGIMDIVESLPEAGQNALMEQIDLLEAEMAELLAEYNAYTLYNEDTHAAIIEKSASCLANIEEIVTAANEAAADNANENAWVAVQNQVANVQEAIANFETIVATLPYASRYEGEEITGPVDAAREWVEATLAEYEAKYEAKELTAEDGVMGEMMDHVAAVHEALNNAAHYDAQRHVQAVVYAWAGDEDEIVGVKDGIMEIVESLPEAGQNALMEQIDLLEAEMAELLAEYNAYTLYNEDTHAAIIEKSASCLANIEEIVTAANEAAADNANENAWVAVQNQVANVQEAIANFEAIVATLPYASRYEGEEITGPVDAAREWVEATLAEYEAKYEAKELTAEDGVMGEMMDHVAAVHEAINNAAKYDAGRYVAAAMYAWAGDEEDIEGAMYGVMAIVETLPEAGQASILEQITLLEAALAELRDEYEAYTLYNEDVHAAIIEKAEGCVANIADIVTMAEEASAAHAAELAAEEARKEANLAAAQLDANLVEELQAELTAVIAGNEEYISADDKDAIEAFLGDTYPMMIGEAFEAVAEEGEYESPINEAELRDIIADIAKNIEANKELAVAIERIKAQISADGIYTLDGRRVESPVKGQVNIFRKDGKFVKMYVK